MPPTTEPWTTGRLLTWTTDYLRQHGSEQPRLDAEVLLAHVRQCQRIELYTTFHELVDDEQRASFRELVRQRAHGTPVAYLVGHREFYSLSFRVTKDVLIPRPETEFVVLTALDIAKSRRDKAVPLKMLDVGTGSGILAICAAKLIEGSQVTAIDMSEAALEIAKSNARDHGLEDSIEFLESDLLTALPHGRQFDLIISNPPYVSIAEYDQLAKDVRDFEPRLALVAGETGTEIIERIIAQSIDHLTPGGWLITELSPMIADQVITVFAAHSAFHPAQIRKDLAGLARVAYAQKE